LSILEEQVDTDSGFPLVFAAEFADFTLTVDNNVSPDGTTNSQHQTKCLASVTILQTKPSNKQVWNGCTMDQQLVDHSHPQ